MMIGGFAQQLGKEGTDEKTLKKLKIISDEASRLDRLLNDLRDFYRPRGGQAEEMDLNKLLSEVYAMVDGECRERGISVAMHLDEQPLRINGDKGRLKQVFLNFAKNALEAMDDGGHFSIQSRRSGRDAEVNLTDDGSGIAEEDLEKVFSPFFTTKRHGTGLGLSVSKSIIEDNNGKLDVASREGEGATFTVRLPLVDG
jgi:signal transduction histidine kinase